MNEDLNWFNASYEVRNLLNPAFCSTVIYEAITSYNNEGKKALPIPLLFLVLPLALHKKTRSKLPKNKKTNLGLWVSENEELSLDLNLRISNLSSFTFLALGNLAVNEIIVIRDEQVFIETEMKGVSSYAKTSEEIEDILRSAGFLGRWFANSSTPASIYTYFGVTP